MTSDEAAEAGAPAETGGHAPRYSGAVANAAAWAFAFLVLRIFAVSDYDWDTAFAVSTTLGVNDGLALVFGSLMAGHELVAVLLVLVLPLLLAAYLWGPRQHRPLLVLFTSLGTVLLMALTVSFRIWWLPVAAAAVFGLLSLIRRLPTRHRLRRVLVKILVRAGAVTAVAGLFAAAFISTPWVPEEQIKTSSGTITGYVLSVDSGYLNILTTEHEFPIVISSDVISRT